VIAQASALNDIYMPVVFVGPTITPTPTATPKPSLCLNEVFEIKGVKVCFSEIDYKPTTSELDEYVVIRNIGGSAVDMEGWRIASDSSAWKYDFPEFSLNSGQTVKVWTKPGPDGSSVLYMNRSEQFWNDNEDRGYLKDDARQTVNSFYYGPAGLTAAPGE
jgi:hypothetical protein